MLTWSRKAQTLIVALLLMAVALPADAEKLRSGVSSDTRAGSQRDNSGRQLALAGSPSNEDTDQVSVEGAISSVRGQLVDQFKSHNIPIRVPEVNVPNDIEKTCDVCIKVVRNAFSFAREHSVEFGGWIARYIRQIAGPPKMTPCGSPYSLEGRLVQPPTFGQQSSKLYLTSEGRLKTVIAR